MTGDARPGAGDRNERRDSPEIQRRPDPSTSEARASLQAKGGDRKPMNEAAASLQAKGGDQKPVNEAAASLQVKGGDQKPTTDARQERPTPKASERPDPSMLHVRKVGVGRSDDGSSIAETFYRGLARHDVSIQAGGKDAGGGGGIQHPDAIAVHKKQNAESRKGDARAGAGIGKRKEEESLVRSASRKLQGPGK